MKRLEETVLKDAAKAAQELLVGYRKERSRLDRRIGKLEALVAAAEAVSSDDEDATYSHPSTQRGPRGAAVRAPKGLTAKHIDAVLQSGRVLTQEELSEAIFEHFGVRHPEGTMRTNLGRGRKRNKYIKTAKGWKLKI